MTWLYALQFALPMVLIGWLVGAPARSGLGFVAQVYGSVAALAAMGLRGIWLVPLGHTWVGHDDEVLAAIVELLLPCVRR